MATGNPPSAAQGTAPSFKFKWGAEGCRLVAQWAVERILARITQSKGADGEPFKPYSTKPITILFTSETARRLKPKGGVPVKNAEGLIVGRHYPGGYAQYKRESTGYAKVTLTLSGELRRNIRVIRTTDNEAVVGIGQSAAMYGHYVDAKRPFIGLTKAEAGSMLDAAVQAVFNRLNGSQAPTGPVAGQ